MAQILLKRVVVPGNEITHDLVRDDWCLHIEAGELDPSLAGLVELTHPANHFQYFLSIPGPEIHSFKQLRRISDSVENIIVQTISLRHVGFDRKDREAYLGSEEFQHPVLELKELACAVCRFAERHDSGVADNLLQRFHVVKTMTCFRSLEANRVSSNPFDGLLIVRLCNRWLDETTGEQQRCYRFLHWFLL